MTHNHAIVWMDLREARVFHFNAADVEQGRVTAHNPFRQVHHKAGVIGAGHMALDAGFFAQIVDDLAGAPQWLLVGPSGAKQELLHYIGPAVCRPPGRAWLVSRPWTIPATANCLIMPGAPSRRSTACCPTRRAEASTTLARPSGHQDGGALEPAGAQIVEGSFALPADRPGGATIPACVAAQKLEGILAGQVGHRDHLAFFPQQPIRKRRDVAHVDAGADDTTTLADRGRCRRHQRTDRREQDGGIEGLGQQGCRAAGPYRAQRPGVSLGRAVAGPREGVDVAPLPATDLSDDVSCRAEAIEPDPPTFACEPERPPADQAGAQQRRGSHGIIESGRAGRRRPRRRPHGSQSRRLGRVR